MWRAFPQQPTVPIRLLGKSAMDYGVAEEVLI
jgi:hypothetical protein